MPRPLRIEYPGAWYHVTCRGNERKDVFLDDKDRQSFLKTLKESLEIFSVEVHCFVLMSNHFHFLLHTPHANLNRFMQRFNTAYTTYFNRRHRRNGHLFQGRYKSLLVEADEYLLELSRYIHLNPVKIKKYQHLSPEEKQALLKDYPWSSLPVYIGRGPQGSPVECGAVLGYLSSDGQRSGKRYEQFVCDGIGVDLSDIYDDVKGQLVLGGESFLKWVQGNFIDGKKMYAKDLAKMRELQRRIDVELIAEHVGRQFEVGPGELLRKRSEHRTARHILIELSYRHNAGRISLRNLGQQLGGIGGDAVLQTHKRVQQRLAGDSDLKKQMEAIERGLLSQ